MNTNDTQIATVEPRQTVQTMELGLMDPGTLRAAKELAQEYINSGFVNKDLTPAAVLVGLDLAHHLRQPAVFVLQNLYVLHGQVGWKSQYLLALANQSGVFDGPVRYEVTGSGDALEVTAWARLKCDGTRVEASASMKMAKSANWTRNSAYRSYPVLMLKYRSCAFLIRTTCPEVMCGMYAADELQDIRASNGQPVQPEQRIEIVEPEPVQAPQIEAAPEPWAGQSKALEILQSTHGLTQAQIEAHTGTAMADWTRAEMVALVSDLKHGRITAEIVRGERPEPEVIEAPEPEPTKKAPKPEPAKVRTWTKGEAAQFQAVCKQEGLGYDEVADTIEREHGKRPSARTPKQRARDIDWILSEVGSDVYSTVCVARDQHLEKARALTHGERMAAAEAAGLEKGGKPLTAPGAMSLVQLRALLGAHDLINAGEE